MEVKPRRPVGRLVTLQLGIGALGLGHAGAGGIGAESATAEDGVLVGRGAAGVDDGVNAAVEDLLAVEAHDGERTRVLGCESRAEHGGAHDSRVPHLGGLCTWFDLYIYIYIYTDVKTEVCCFLISRNVCFVLVIYIPDLQFAKGWDADTRAPKEWKQSLALGNQGRFRKSPKD